jgi:inosine/xanthosine triphosphatase
MKKIIVASGNPVKSEAVLLGFQAMFPREEFQTEPLEVSSGVADQPMSDLETMKGAHNRAVAARENCPDADYWAGVEGGIDQLDGCHIAFAWVVILSEEQEGSARTGIFELPFDVSRLINDGMELGDADDAVFGTQNSKQAKGAVGLLTGNALTRAGFYTEAVMLALIPFKNPALYDRKR